MKIATYNVWYENIGVRTPQLLEQIDRIDADIIGLQEVPRAFFDALVAYVKYPYHTYMPCDHEIGTGLAFLSKHPVIGQFSLLESAEFDNSTAHNALFEANGITISVTNVHLPWESVLAKEKQALAIDRYIHSQKDKAHFFVLLGDFNGSLQSSVHHYLLGERSLMGCEAKPCWNDLASAYAMLHGHTAEPTLDFVNNPRWRQKNTKYVPETCDRIYIMESYDWNYIFRLRCARVFGKEVSPETGYAPSDHYGVIAEVDFSL